jgi:4-amino-4-deoxy-L-arabinose transferase-like glycosyltransferase
MRITERVGCGRFPVERAAFTPVASPADVARRTTATDAAPRIVFAICVLAVAVRLIFINQPYIDHWSWRQSDVAAIARNFLENGFSFGYPQVEWAGNAPGYVGTEFPILPFVAALCYEFAGVHEWIGRIQAVILFAVSLPFFFLLVREIFGSTAVVWASFFYSFAPLNIFAGRSFMPDVPSLSLAIVALYLFLQWIEHGAASSFFIGAIAISLSFLIKITSIVIAAPLVYIVVARLCEAPGVSQKRPPIIRLVLFLAIALIPSATWYWHAHEIAQQFYPYHFFGEGGIRIESFPWYWHIAQQVSVSSLTLTLSVMALVGLVLPQSRGQKYSRLFHWWLAATIIFIIVVGYGNRHRWYQLPLVPIAAAFAGAGCAFFALKISSRVIAAALSVLLVSSFLFSAFRYVQPFYQSSAAQLRDAGLELKKVTAPEALIVAADMGDPTIFYYAERKGWHFLENDAIYNGNPDDSAQAIENLERLRRGGATHFVYTKNTFWWMRSYPEFATEVTNNATLIEATPEFRIYRLNPAAR